MAVTAKLYGNAVLGAFNKEIDWNSDTIKVSLHTSTYTPDQDAHDFQDDLTNEVSAVGTGYTTGGNTLASPTAGYTAGTNVAKFSGANVTFTAVTLTARYAVIYDAQSGVAATNRLIAYIDFGADVSPVAGDLVITWNAAGIVTCTVAT
jgi:hypothetical protein